jgi:hypothetical protein
MREEIHMSKDFVLKQVRTHHYIKKEVWHNLSPTLKTLRILNRIILCLLTIVLVFYLWHYFILGQNILYALMGVSIYLFFFSFGVSNILSEIKLCSNYEDPGSIRAEIQVYEKYLSTVKGNLYLRSVLLMLFLFISILVWGANTGKVTMLIGAGVFMKICIEDCVLYLISIFSVLMVIVNSIFFSSLNMSLNKEMKNEIY